MSAKAMLCAVIAMMLGSLPMISLWMDFPVTPSMKKARAIVSNIEVTAKSEVFDTGVAISVTCYQHKLFFVLRDSALVKLKPFSLRTCDQSASNLFAEKYKHQSVTGYFSETNNVFIPIELLEKRELVTSIALSLAFMFFGFLIGLAVTSKIPLVLHLDKPLSSRQILMMLVLGLLTLYFIF